MQYTVTYKSPLGNILMAAAEEGLTGLWFEGQKYYAEGLGTEYKEGTTHSLNEAKRWLDMYFAGIIPDFMPPLCLIGTEFQRRVWDILRCIPYGGTMTYGEIAGQLAGKSASRILSRAVGGAVGRNPISIIVPCHRVIGAGGKLTGYAGGLDRKRELLRIEGIIL